MNAPIPMKKLLEIHTGINGAEGAVERPPLPGFRLARVEVYNWGTFDAAVHSVQPRGQTTLLVGENGSGKSTIIDAILTLLVRPMTRNYNVAAGAAKNERDERTYIRGAYDRQVGPDGRPQVQYLRSGHGFYSVLLAVFANAVAPSSLTVAQVLYLNSENAVERIYAYCDGDRGIVHDLSGLESVSSLAKQLRGRGFETTSSYTQYFQWLQRRTGLRAKAMDVFNQTVAVKDVQRLDAFMRQHMLQRQPWNDRLAKLLTHFHELSEAHGMLVKVRRQNELLKPIVDLQRKYFAKLGDLNHASDLLDALDLYFAQETQSLLTPLCQRWENETRALDADIEQLANKLEKLHSGIFSIRRDIEMAGNERLRQLPGLIEHEESLARHKQVTRTQFESALHVAGIGTRLTSPEQFLKVVGQLERRKRTLLNARAKRLKKIADLQIEIGRLTTQRVADVEQLQSMEKHKSNLPQSLVFVRDRMCEHLSLTPAALPFVAELLAVPENEHEWEASIEHVLFGFARSLLVSEEFYSSVASYLDKTRLEDNCGQGQRLVYHRVSTHNDGAESRHGQRSLADKLNYIKHPLTLWLRSEIVARFDYLACDSIDEFHRATGLAMTRNRHIKSNQIRHEKDDRTAPHDRRNFVLGWDNRGQSSSLRESIDELDRQLAELSLRLQNLQDENDQDLGALGALDLASQVSNYDQIDDDRHRFVVSQLSLEKQCVEHAGDKTRLLQQTEQSIRAEVSGYQADRDAAISTRTRTAWEHTQATVFLNRATEFIKVNQQNGRWERCQPLFGELREIVRDPLTLESLPTLPQRSEQKLRERVGQFSAKLRPIERETISAMTRFFREFPGEHVDLDANIESLQSFVELFERISRDDLPRHEERFKQRLNEKVLHEVGILNSSLENDRQEIRDKIAQLNSALKMLDWNDGTFMQLEVQDVNDREIQAFRRELSACLNDTFDGVMESNEVTFLRIEKLVGKLRDEAHQRWRDKVIDVRNWFDFAAREQDRANGKSLSFYDGGTGQSGGEKGKLAFLVLVAAIAYQYDLDPLNESPDRFHFVMVDEMFSRSDDQHAEYALQLFQQFGLQLLIAAPLDAKVKVTESHVGTYVHVVKNKQSNRSSLISITAEELRDSVEPTVH